MTPSFAPLRLWLMIGFAACALSWDAVAEQPQVPRIAIVTTVWRHNAHADVIGSRLLEGYTLDGKGEFPKLKLVSAYIDQEEGDNKGKKLCEQHGVKLFDTIAGALTLGGDKLAVDGVLLIAEHGNYPENEFGSFIFPKRRMFGEIAQVFEKNGKAVPVFCDKHLADTWADTDWFWKTAQKHSVPLMAGSSLPVSWRYPPRDVERDRPLKEIVATSYHRLDSYGFHGLEMVQCLAERRKGGETGVKQVRCISGDEVWKLFDRGECSEELLNLAAATFTERPLPAGKTPRTYVKKPILFVIDYRDGLRASILTMDGSNVEWSAAWRYADSGKTEATNFYVQEARPFMHFTYLLKAAEPMFSTGKPPWKIERTVMTSGLLDALLVSNKRGGEIIPTPFLDLSYRNDDWNWGQPPPPPPDRPIPAQ